MTPPDPLKYIASLFPVFGASIQLWTGLAQKLRRVFRERDVIGDRGWSFRIIWVYPLYLGNFFLVVIAVMSLASIAGGAIEHYGCNKTGVVAQYMVRLFDNSLWLAVIYVLIAVVFHFEALPRMVHLVALFVATLHRELRNAPGFINAAWMLRNGENAIAVNISPLKCRLIANFLLSISKSGAAASKEDYASRFPGEWPAANRANALLFACVIEGLIHDLPRSHPAKEVPLSELYKLFGDERKVELWSPARFLSGEASKDIMATLAGVSQEGLRILGGESFVNAAVSEAAETLATKYSGDAAELAYGSWLTFRRRSLDRVERRLRAFPKMGSEDANSMAKLFRKLAYSQGVWSGIGERHFPFQFSRGVALLLLNCGSLVTMPSVKEIPLDSGFKGLSIRAVRRIVDEALRLIRLDKQLQERWATDRWTVSREVDYLLWWLSRKPSGWCLTKASLEAADSPDDTAAPWKLSNAIICRG